MENEILDNIDDKPSITNAGFLSRLGAYLTDIIPIVILVYLVMMFGLGYNPFPDPQSPMVASQDGIVPASMNRIINRYLAFGVWIVYCILFDFSGRQGTFGKSASGLRVVNAQGEQIDFSKSVVRNLAKVISYLPLGLGFFWAVFDKRNRTWHDMITNTHVVKR